VSKKERAMSSRVIILGGGIIGLCAAHAARARGLQVTVVDRNSPERDGCSFGNAGMIVPSHFLPLAAPGMVALGLKWMGQPEAPFALRPRFDWDLWTWCYRFWRSATRAHVERAAPLLRDLHLASRAGYEQLQSQLPRAFGLVQRGLLMLCNTKHGFLEEAHSAEKAHRLGMPADVLNPQQTADLEPDLKMSIEGSVHYPRDCHLNPQLLMQALQEDLTQQGVTFLWKTHATSVRRAGRVVQALQTSQGEIPGDAFVLCGGVWSAEFARSLDLSLPLQAGKGYSFTLTDPPRIPRTCAILTEARVAVTPLGSQLRFGGTLELGSTHERINPRRVEGIKKSIPLYYPEFSPQDFAHVTPWQGLRPCSPDGLPYLGWSRHYENLVVACGHAMMGVSLAPVTARIVVDLLEHQQTEFDLTLLSPDRFA